jgi:hypothetical protein
MAGIAGYLCLGESHTRAMASPAVCGNAAPQTADAIYFDPNGLIVQRNCDGGDSAQREGWYWLGRSIRESAEIKEPWGATREMSFQGVMSQLEIGQTGTFRRNPVKWNDPSDFTRDQTIPLVAAMGVLNDVARLQRFYQELRRRNWFAQKRGDEMTTPVYRNLIARARNARPNWVTDAASLYAAAGSRIVSAHGRPDDVGDDLNLIVILLVATFRFRSGGVDSAREYYSKNRPDNYGMFLQSYRKAYGTDWEGKIPRKEMTRRMDAGIKAGWTPDCPRVLGALRWYFRAESGGCPGLAELYEPMIRKWFQ